MKILPFTLISFYIVPLQIGFLFTIVFCTLHLSAAHFTVTICSAKSVGKYPNCFCRPPFTGTPPNCIPPPASSSQTNTQQKCPPGLIGKYPNCVEPCPLFQIGWKPHCEPIKCPPGTRGENQPNCEQIIACPNGEVGTYPNCVKPPIQCKTGYFGNPPQCKQYYPNPNYEPLGYLPPTTTIKPTIGGYLPPTTTQNTLLGYLPPKTETPYPGYAPQKTDDPHLLPPKTDRPQTGYVNPPSPNYNRPSYASYRPH